MSLEIRSRRPRFLYQEVQEEVERLRKIRKEFQREWNEEVSKYEETMDLKTSDRRRTLKDMPRRNYKNATGTVQDPSLYPYHNAYYPLLDAYDMLYVEDDEEEPDLGPNIQEPSPSSAKSAKERWIDLWQDKPPPMGHLGCSEQALRLVFGSEKDEAKRDENFVVEEPELILKLYRHAVSDLQRDFHLARYLVDRLSRTRYFTRADFLRKFMAIHMMLGGHIATCRGRCMIDHQNENDDEYQLDHDCKLHEELNYILFFRTLSGTIRFMPVNDEQQQRQHLMIVAAAIQFALDGANPGAAEMDKILATRNTVATAYSSSSTATHDSVATQQQQSRAASKWRLMNHLHEANNTEFDDDEGDDDDGDESDDDGHDESDSLLNPYDKMPYLILRFMMVGIREEFGMRSFFNKDKRMTMPQPMEQFLLFCGEALARRIVFNSQSQLVCAKFVQTVLEFYEVMTCSNQQRSCDNRRLLYRDDSLLEQKDPVFGNLKQSHDRSLVPTHRNVLYPNRFANFLVKKATYRHFVTSSSRSEHEKFSLMEDMMDVVRTLYSMNLVHLNTVGRSWGDVLFEFEHCGDRISPVDPAIFDLEWAIPVIDYNDEEADEEVETDINGHYILWDENGCRLDDDQAMDRYRFSLCLLTNAWLKPWTPASHFSYSKEHRLAVNTLFKCVHRLLMPRELAYLVAEFLPRDWWPDDRVHCWCAACMNSRKGVRDKLAPEGTLLVTEVTSDDAVVVPRQSLQKKTSSSSFVVCPKCRIAVYKNESHRKKDKKNHDFHCGKFPLRKLTRREEENIEMVLNGTYDFTCPLATSDATRSTADQMMEEADDDDEEWESMDEDDEEFELDDDGDDSNPLEEKKEPSDISKFVFRFMRESSLK